MRGETGPPHREPASNEVISTDGASYCTIAYRRMTKVFQSEPSALREHVAWTIIRPSFRVASAQAWNVATIRFRTSGGFVYRSNLSRSHEGLVKLGISRISGRELNRDARPYEPWVRVWAQLMEKTGPQFLVSDTN